MSYKNKQDADKYQREYYLRNRERKLKQRKILYSKNRDKILKGLRESYIPHPIVLKTAEEKKAKMVAWRYQNRENYNAYMKEWNLKNRERLLPLRKLYYNTRLSIHVQYTRLCATAKERNYECALTKEEFTQIIARPCNYCGENEKRRGIDRVDNTQGYTLQNSTPCCKICNYMKKQMTVKEFLDHIEKIYNKGRN